MPLVCGPLTPIARGFFIYMQILPKWNPNKMTLLNIKSSSNKEKAFKSFRSSSSGFIKNKIVRDAVLKKSGNKCALCGSYTNLQVDHIESVYYCFHNNKIYYCNTIDNLQSLCGLCNVKKSH